jgi:hypothetical protein
VYFIYFFMGGFLIFFVLFFTCLFIAGLRLPSSTGACNAEEPLPRPSSQTFTGKNGPFTGRKKTFLSLQFVSYKSNILFKYSSWNIAKSARMSVLQILMLIKRTRFFSLFSKVARILARNWGTGDKHAGNKRTGTTVQDKRNRWKTCVLRISW